jgi:hypothetical protein
VLIGQIELGAYQANEVGWIGLFERSAGCSRHIIWSFLEDWRAVFIV